MPLDFKNFDTRNYPTLPVREGYAAWSATYDETVPDELDIRLLEQLDSSLWKTTGRAVDLGCGTGRIGTWLTARGLQKIDGVDLTAEMLGHAREKNIYNELRVADVCETGLASDEYDLAIASLIDEHLPDLNPLYREAARLLSRSGQFVITGFHPQFMITTGIPTHFNRDNGEPTAIDFHIHLLSEHIAAARATNLQLVEFNEGVVDEEWLRIRPKWEKYRNVPVSFVMVFKR